MTFKEHTKYFNTRKTRLNSLQADIIKHLSFNPWKTSNMISHHLRKPGTLAQQWHKNCDWHWKCNSLQSHWWYKRKAHVLPTSWNHNPRSLCVKQIKSYLRHKHPATEHPLHPSYTRSASFIPTPVNCKFLLNVLHIFFHCLTDVYLLIYSGFHAYMWTSFLIKRATNVYETNHNFRVHIIHIFF